MRQAEVQARLRFTLAVVKMRDSAFDPVVRQYTIEPRGLRIGEAVPPVRSILTEEPGAAGT
jgi:circadian clock protein KaiC